MWGLEHLLAFGPPGNNTEILDGHASWKFHRSGQLLHLSLQQ
jgi:hypothetical protein